MSWSLPEFAADNILDVDEVIHLEGFRPHHKMIPVQNAGSTQALEI